MLLTLEPLLARSPFLVLHVRRSNLVGDALRELSIHSDIDLKKPLKVSFPHTLSTLSSSQHFCSLSALYVTTSPVYSGFSIGIAHRDTWSNQCGDWVFLFSDSEFWQWTVYKANRGFTLSGVSTVLRGWGRKYFYDIMQSLFCSSAGTGHSVFYLWEVATKFSSCCHVATFVVGRTGGYLWFV